MTEARAGWILGQRYRLDSLLGRGGMGSVWKAHHITLNSPVAIKLMEPEIAANQAGLERFVREAQAAAALRSPHVVQTLDYGVHEGTPYIAMELMVGESLAKRLERLGRLSVAETMKVIAHVARALAKAHELGIVHRDLKPDNIFIVQNEDDEVVKVLDFGIAKIASLSVPPSMQTRTGVMIGTAYYASPEQMEGSKSVDHRTDIWAMGVIAYECLLGFRPFEGEAIGELVLRICARPMPVPSDSGPVPPGFDLWFARACARDLTERFGTVRELSDSLRSLPAGPGDTIQASLPQLRTSSSPLLATTSPVVETSHEEIWKPKRTSRFLTGGAVVVVAAIGAAFWMGKASPSGDAAPAVAATAASAPASAALAAPPSATTFAPTAILEAAVAADEPSRAPADSGASGGPTTMKTRGAAPGTAHAAAPRRRPTPSPAKTAEVGSAPPIEPQPEPARRKPNPTPPRDPLETR